MLVTVHVFPDGRTCRSAPMDDSLVEQWVVRSRAETGYLGHEYWAEYEDGEKVEEE